MRKDEEDPWGGVLIAEDWVHQGSSREAELWKLGAAMVRLLSAWLSPSQRSQETECIYNEKPGRIHICRGTPRRRSGWEPWVKCNGKRRK